MMTAQYQAALHSYAEGRYEEAMQQFSELLYEDPRNPKLHIWLGATFRKAGKMEYAKVQYQQVLTLTEDPDLLDLASTSLAQIQQKLASPSYHKSRVQDTALNDGRDANHANAKPNARVATIESDRNGDATLLTESVGLPTIASRNGKLDGNAISNGKAQNGLGKSEGKVKASSNGSPNGSLIYEGVAIPPPPAIAALIKPLADRQEESPFIMTADTDLTETDATGEQVDVESKHHQVTEETANPSNSFFGQAIAKIQNGGRRAQQSRKSNSAKSRSAKSKQSTLSLGDIIFGKTSIPQNPSAKLSDEDLEKADTTNATNASTINANATNANAEDLEALINTGVVVDTERDIVASVSNAPSNIQSNNPASSPKEAIALEDLFKFSGIGQKITILGTVLATIPAIAIGVTAYQVGNGLLLEKVKQERQAEVINLAKGTGAFLKTKADDVAVLKKLLTTSDSGRNTLQNPRVTEPRAITNNQKQVLQQLTNRLNLYAQAYPNYNSIAAFSANGEFLAQSNNSKTLQVLNNDLLGKVISRDNVLLSEPTLTKDGVYIYAIAAIKDPVSQKVSMILQAEIALDSLVNHVKSSKSNRGDQDHFYLIDSFGKYVAASQSVTFGGDTSEQFTMLPELRASQLPNLRELNKGDRRAQILAYAPLPDLQTYGLSSWDVITTIDKSLVMGDIQNLLFLVAAGIAATPLAVAVSAYALSRNLSNRLKDIRAALFDLQRGDLRGSFAALSVEGNDEIADISLSVNRMSEQFQVMMQKQEQEKQRLQLQVMKLFQVLSKLARENGEEVKNGDLESISDDKILNLGKKVRSELVQHYAEIENYRQQKDQLKAQLTQMLRDMQSLADGDLAVSTRSIDGNLTDVAIFFDDVTRGLKNIISQVRTAANQVNFALGQNDQAIANLCSASQRQVDVVTRSINTIQLGGNSAREIVDHSQRAVQSSQAIAVKVHDSDQAIALVVDKVSELQNTVANTAKRVKHLGEVSQKITKAISFVNEIAIQTNFLAINASLEASRQGHKDLSFAMVAEDVGELASRSIVATKEMEGMLSEIQQETNAVMSAIASSTNQVAESASLAITAKDNLRQIGNISHEIDELMNSIANATTSQVQTSEGVASLMQDISHIAQRTLATSGEVSKAMRSTKTYASDLQKSLAHFKS